MPSGCSRRCGGPGYRDAGGHGVARANTGALYFLYSSGQGGLTGIWQLSRSGAPRLVVPLPADTFPNALVVDGKRDRFLVTDSSGGRIWQAPLRGGEASVWSADPALAPGGFFGANGMKIHDGTVWASNSDHGTIVRIPMAKAGGSGRAEVRATGLEGIDDIDFTGRGTEILAAINQAGKLVRVSADGTHETLLDAEEGIQGTTAVAVRGNSVYVTNGANLAGNDPNLLIAEFSGTDAPLGSGPSQRCTLPAPHQYLAEAVASPEIQTTEGISKGPGAWQRIIKQYPRLFAHWAWNPFPVKHGSVGARG